MRTALILAALCLAGCSTTGHEVDAAFTLGPGGSFGWKGPKSHGPWEWETQVITRGYGTPPARVSGSNSVESKAP